MVLAKPQRRGPVEDRRPYFDLFGLVVGGSRLRTHARKHPAPQRKQQDKDTLFMRGHPRIAGLPSRRGPNVSACSDKAIIQDVSIP